MTLVSWSKPLTVSSQVINAATDKCILPQSVLQDLISSSTLLNEELPYPLAFSITIGSLTTHVGVREFSSPEGSISLPSMAIDNLSTKEGAVVQVKFVSLQKGVAAKLRPLEAGYDDTDWKIMLESSLRSNFTVLTKGEVLKLSGGMKFLVDALFVQGENAPRPAHAVCIVDTDLEVDIEALSESQALETLKKSAARTTESKDIILMIDSNFEGSADGYLNMSLETWNRKQDIYIHLESVNPDVDLLVSTEPKPRLDQHAWSNLTPSASKLLKIATTNQHLADTNRLYVSVYSATASPFSLTISQNPETLESWSDRSVPGPNEVLCDNCLCVIPHTAQLHMVRCRKLNVRCKLCDHVSPAGTESRHWHCQESRCQVHGEGDLDLHKQRFHLVQSCICGQVFPDIVALANHKLFDCPNKIIECRFCHLKVQKGLGTNLSYSDTALGYSGHESECGAKTIDCEVCLKPIQVKNMPIHAKIHDKQRLGHSKPLICSNENCVRRRNSKNILGLCETCYGPLYTSSMDDAQKLQTRLSRRYAIQLAMGCKKEWCKNVFCATATGQKVGYSEALRKVSEMNLDKHRFCVDGSTQRKRNLADMLECEGEYDMAWCCRAVDDAAGDLNVARKFLELNGVRKDETRR